MQPRASVPCVVRSWCRGGFLSPAQGLQTEHCGPARSSVPRFSSAINSAGSARIEGRSSRSVRGLAGRAGEEEEQGAAPGCRGPARADPALGPSSPTRVPGDRDHRSPQPPLTCVQFCVQGAASSGASSMPPESRNRDGAASASSAAIRLLLCSRIALGAGADLSY
ncbi:hypothetical protein NDU88_003836 [Pleurodeles waltl]|uniref:Uncharacterized protein n=1 Tax=Pleurodeles waltl TaxID=8319 RepID=A0AAV7UD98_PLEWA|nr:hypothetical protein NDU88_003836 [Pleurodeles waltl]